MKVYKIGCLLIFVIVLAGPLLAHSNPSRKPLPPVSIMITPVNQTITPKDIKPGDTVTFNITAVSDVDAKEMSIKIELTGGARLISGELSWSGPAVKKEPRTVPLTVQAPEKGIGKIKARASLPPSDGTHFSSQAQFSLGPETRAKPEHEGVIKKDKKGRDVIEYR